MSRHLGLKTRRREGMFKRQTSFVVFLMVIASAGPSALGQDPDVIRAVFGERIRNAIGERRIFEFGTPEGTRSPSGPRLYEQTVNSVVLILRVMGSETSIGGGGFVSEEGFVVTNWHVVEGSRRVGVWLRYNTPSINDLTKDNVIIGEVIAVDQVRDLALIRLNWKGVRIKPLSLADFSQVKIGQDVFAIGHPKQYLWSYTEGVVSQIRPRHSWKDEDGNEYQATLIQTQTPLSLGSSGAPLFDATGKVIGITSGGKSDAQNLNFAIAVNEIQDFISKRPVLQKSEGRKLESTPLPSPSSAIQPTQPAPQTAARPEDRFLPTPRASPDEVYRQALNEYGRRNYDLAIKGFETYIAQFSDAPLTSGAYYWLGESYYGAKHYALAITAFDGVSKRFPDDPRAVSALLRQSDAYLELGEKDRAQSVLNEVMRRFPRSTAATQAERRLRDLGLR